MIGIFGGTFDPVHYGHLRPALEIVQQLDLEELRLIPCRQPPHRDMPVASADMRLQMLEAAVHGVEGLVIDPRELHRAGSSWMVDTLESIHGDTGDKTLCLLLGVDTFAGLDTWHQWQRIFELAHIVVMQRPGNEIPFSVALANELDKRSVNDITSLMDNESGNIFFCSVMQLDISASLIRKLVAEGSSARYLLPDKVLDIIENERVYDKDE